jgi:hypothetical protein
MEPLERFNDEDEAFLRRFTVPEEDRRLYTSTPRSGGYRWFLSPNVIPIERERSRMASISLGRKCCGCGDE